MNYPNLISAISAAHQQAQAGAAGAVNRHLILRNWLIGAYLVEFEQNGEDRAKYGAGLLNRVAVDLRKHSVTGCSQQMLERMRRFFREYPQAGSMISSPPVRISQKPQQFNDLEIPSPLARKSADPPASVPRPLPAPMLLRLSWTHILELLGLDDPWKRAFYENECLKGNWSKRQLQRLQQSSLVDKLPVAGHLARRTAAAMLFPIHPRDCRRLKAFVLQRFDPSKTVPTLRLEKPNILA